MHTDPIADMLTRIRNAYRAKHSEVEIISSKFKVELAKILQEEGYISSYQELASDENSKFKRIIIQLKYDENEKPVITGIKRISKPGLRVYSNRKNIKKVFAGLGVSVVSSSKGLISDRKARRINVGGEIVCHVW